MGSLGPRCPPGRPLRFRYHSAAVLVIPVFAFLRFSQKQESPIPLLSGMRNQRGPSWHEVSVPLPFGWPLGAFGCQLAPKGCRFDSLLGPFGLFLGLSRLFGALVWPFAVSLCPVCVSREAPSGWLCRAAFGRSHTAAPVVGSWGLCCPSTGGLATRLGGCFPLSLAGLLSLFLGVRPLEWEDAPFFL